MHTGLCRSVLSGEQLPPAAPTTWMGRPTLPGSPLPVDTGLGRDMPSSVAWGPRAGGGAPCTVVSSADRGRQSPASGLAVGSAGGKVPKEEDMRSLHTDVQEADREQKPPSLSS